MVLVIYGVSLLPAFGPPSWVLVVFYSQVYHLAILPTVLLAAFSTAAGRLTLALAVRHLRKYLPIRMTSNLDAAKTTLERHRVSVWALTGFFVLSPLPSAQLFEAAALLETRLLPLVAAFMVGRLVTYSIYVTAGNLTIGSVETILAGGYLSPVSIGIQILMILAVVGLLTYRSKRK